MGYALFTARKLSLTTRVNQMNAQLMSLSQRQMDLANQIATKESANALRTNSANAQAYSVFAAAVQGGGDTTQAQAALNKTLSDNSSKTAMDDAEIQQLEAKQTQIDLQRKNLETQLNAAQQELESVEKAEQSAIKSSTPGYVG